MSWSTNSFYKYEDNQTIQVRKSMSTYSLQIFCYTELEIVSHNKISKSSVCNAFCDPGNPNCQSAFIYLAFVVNQIFSCLSTGIHVCVLTAFCKNCLSRCSNDLSVQTLISNYYLWIRSHCFLPCIIWSGKIFIHSHKFLDSMYLRKDCSRDSSKTSWLLALVRL